MGAPGHEAKQGPVVPPGSSPATRPPSRSGTLRETDDQADVAAPVGYARALIITLACTLAMVNNIMSGASISIALPDIGKDLGISQANLQWLITSYSLTSGCFLLLFGRLADLFGRKKVFLIGNSWFLVWAIGCGFAPNAISLDVMRAFQGMGAAAAVPSAIGILAHEFPPSVARSIAFATFSAGAPLGGAIGFVIGGLMTQYASVKWRGVFYVSAGIAALTIIAAAVGIHKDKPSQERDRRIDWVGAILSTTALVLLSFSLAQSSSAKDGWRTPCELFSPKARKDVFAHSLKRYPCRARNFAIVIGLLRLLGTLPRNTYDSTTSHALGIVDPCKRKIRSYSTSGLFRLVMLYDLAIFRHSTFLYYQEYLGISPVDTTIRLLPMPVSGLLCNLVIALFIGRISGSVLIGVGCFFTSLAALLFAVITPSATYWAFGFPAAAVVVFGADFMFATGSIFVAKIALPHEQSLAGGIFNTLNQLGTAFGLAIASVVNNNVHRSALRESGDELGSLLRGYRAAFWTCFGFGMAALVLTLIFLRGIGIVGHSPKSHIAETEERLKEKDGV
ncbi:unnamed protein product [Rhizoctonia solani]|uniref:Major facilitator superfamily (MFS) profile domain-containing protein n=1 Tax=Rhizoctonia solani TaxID=456999 RepID=A0A8H2X4U1_9AGAM|nr:unnamed protein product [Rhizoctonia solani]